MTTRPDQPGDSWLPTRLALLAAASAGDTGAAFHLVSGLLSDGVPFPTILFEVLSPLEAEVGDRWHRGEWSVTEEHTVTSTLETVVALLAGSFDIPEDARRLVVACAEGDNHSLPARMVAAHLVFQGWRAVFLGTGQPAVDLGAFLREKPPEALILSCAIATALPGARACIREAHAAGVPVLAGGPGFGPDGARAHALGADAWAPDAERVDEILQHWKPDPTEAEARARDGGDELPRLDRSRAAVLARAVDSPNARQAAVDPTRLRFDLELLLDALAASVLLDNPEVVVDLAAWQRSSAGPAVAEVGAALAALREALPVDLPRVAAFLDAAASPPATR